MKSTRENERKVTVGTVPHLQMSLDRSSSRGGAKMRLYHFTCLFQLPAILREGVTRGEVPAWPERNYTKLPNAANLTSIGSREAQQWCNELNIFDKTRIRLAVEVTEDELMAFNEMVDMYETPKWWVKTLDHLNQRDNWYFAFDGIPVEHIVEIAIADDTSGEYVPISDVDLKRLVGAIEDERKTLPWVQTPSGPAFACTEPPDSWLLDGPLSKQFHRMQEREAEKARCRQKEQRRKDRERRRKNRLTRRARKRARGCR